MSHCRQVRATIHTMVDVPLLGCRCAKTFLFGGVGKVPRLITAGLGLYPVKVSIATIACEGTGCGYAETLILFGGVGKVPRLIFPSG